jgi:hypothetical protein
MSVWQWLRRNAEHYLLVAAQGRLAQRYAAPPPAPPHGLREIFWLRLFAPVYARIPWRWRSRVLYAMPGSHRRTWSAWTHPPRRRDPAV